MKTLTLHQPWAQLVAAGMKAIETRSWGTSYRGRLAIHAGAKLPRLPKFGRSRELRRHERQADPANEAVHERGLCRCGWDATTCMREGLSSLPLGAVVATVQLVDVVPIHENGCDCGDESDPWIEYIHWRRPLLNLYTKAPTPRRQIMVADIFTGAVAICPVNGNDDMHPWTGTHRSDGATEDLPFGDYRCGRFAWLLNDVQALEEPIPAKGRQGLWNWDGAP